MPSQSRVQVSQSGEPLSDGSMGTPTPARVVDSPEEIAALVAKANEPKATSAPAANNGSFTSEQLRHRMSSMNTDQLRQQAATMRAMGPAALRNMNPQMARMTDDQINMAINQMVSAH